MSEVESFFTDGEAYERRMGRWSRVVGEVFLDWLAMPNGLRWIDVGCGNGAFTEVLIARCAPSAVSPSTRRKVSCARRARDPASSWRNFGRECRACAALSRPHNGKKRRLAVQTVASLSNSKL